MLKRASATLKKKLKSRDTADRSAAAYAAIILALREGFTDAEIRQLIEHHSQGVGERYVGRNGKDLVQDIERIRGKWQRDVRQCEQLRKDAEAAGLPDGFARDASSGELLRIDKAIASARNEVLLVLDELKQAEPDDVAHALYMLSQGKGKQRAGRAGQARSAKTWNVPYISTGEISTQARIPPGSGPHHEIVNASPETWNPSSFPVVCSVNGRGKWATLRPEHL